MWFQLIIILLVAFLGIIAFLRHNFTIATVHGDSMYPTLAEGDRLLSLNFLPRLWLRKGQIVLGHIDHLDLPSSIEASIGNLLMSDTDSTTDDTSMVFAFENLSESEVENLPIEPDYPKFIKRIIGLPGDTVCIPISSLHEFMQTVLRSAEGGNAAQSHCDANGNLVWTVPEDHCFVRGDGLVSMDSLTVGPIPLSAITGITVLKLPRRSDIDPVQQLREASNAREA